MIEIHGTTNGKCKLCTSPKAKKKPLFIVKGPISGNFCSEHLWVVAEQPQKEDSPSPLFDRVSADGRA